MYLPPHHYPSMVSSHDSAAHTVRLAVKEVVVVPDTNLEQDDPKMKLTWLSQRQDEDDTPSRLPQGKESSAQNPIPLRILKVDQG